MWLGRGVLCVVLCLLDAAQVNVDVASQQLLFFAANTTGPIGVLTTSFGAPVEHQHAMYALNGDLIRNTFLMESYLHFNRERIQERVVHAKGAGAFGFFEVTHEFKDICRAKLFSKVGKKTKVAVRFSPVATERGGSEFRAETRGFAIKFYTEEGNFDLPGLNTPMFVIKDPIFFPTFARALKRNPMTNMMQDANMLWDFLTNRPESMFSFMMIFSDRTNPASYRQMPGFSIHTMQLFNEEGDPFFVRFRLDPEAGVKNLAAAERNILAGQDPDFLTRDLFNAIATGKFPVWKLSAQVLTPHDVKKAKFDPFDVSKVLPMDRYPLRPVGRLVLNKNPENYFAQVEQLSFCPDNLVPGITGAPDQLYEARMLAYRDAANYRLGANFNRILVNRPLSPMFTYARDGRAPVQENGGSSPNYLPNSFNGPVPYVMKKRPKLLQVVHDESLNFEQARELYVNEFSKLERQNLVLNIVNSLGQAAPFLQERAVKLCAQIHPDFGKSISIGLLANATTAGAG